MSEDFHSFSRPNTMANDKVQGPFIGTTSLKTARKAKGKLNLAKRLTSCTEHQIQTV